MKDKYELATEEVLAEVRRAKGMFKENFHNQHEGYAVILEEVDELWGEVKKNQKKYDLPSQRKEAIQAAAMCVRFVAELLNQGGNDERSVATEAQSGNDSREQKEKTELFELDYVANLHKEISEKQSRIDELEALLKNRE